MDARYCCQCRNNAGTIGCFVFAGSLSASFVELSPTFDSLADLYAWFRANGWVSVGPLWDCRSEQA